MLKSHMACKVVHTKILLGEHHIGCSNCDLSYFIKIFLKDLAKFFTKLNFTCQLYPNDLKDCSGQIYDNRADMVGKVKDIRP